ncbi:hypothetical protein [Mycetohabitans sp. B46]|uniref:hypothetical protein n=1 Tax=Mycetohabitans sp. B46 TaxID=2772536 RepID=UPI00307F8244
MPSAQSPIGGGVCQARQADMTTLMVDALANAATTLLLSPCHRIAFPTVNCGAYLIRCGVYHFRRCGP